MRKKIVELHSIFFYKPFFIEIKCYTKQINSLRYKNVWYTITENPLIINQSIKYQKFTDKFLIGVN